MRRIQAFEFNELETTPRFIRDSIVEILGNGLKIGRVLKSVGPVFMNFCDRAGCSRVLDLCSGTGEPAGIFLESLKKSGFDPPRFVLSDLFPNQNAMAAVKARHPNHVEVLPSPVDATDVPEAVDCPARTIINAFHHFSDALAADILADCVAKRRAVFIVEGFQRRPAGFFPLFPPLVTAFHLNPFVTRRERALKLFFSFVVPAIAACGTWDAVVSFLRTRNREELLDLVRPLSQSYQWEFVDAPYPAGGRNGVFMGFPV